MWRINRRPGGARPLPGCRRPLAPSMRGGRAPALPGRRGRCRYRRLSFFARERCCCRCSQARKRLLCCTRGSSGWSNLQSLNLPPCRVLISAPDLGIFSHATSFIRIPGTNKIRQYLLIVRQQFTAHKIRCWLRWSAQIFFKYVRLYSCVHVPTSITYTYGRFTEHVGASRFLVKLTSLVCTSRRYSCRRPRPCKIAAPSCVHS